MRLLLAAAALALIPGTANAADWYRFLSGPPLTYYIDADTIVSDGAWMRFEQYAVYETVQTTGVKAVGATIALDCARNVFRVQHFTAFAADNSTLQSIDDPAQGAEYEAVPGSAAAAAMKFVCQNQRGSATHVADPRPSQT